MKSYLFASVHSKLFFHLQAGVLATKLCSLRSTVFSGAELTRVLKGLFHRKTFIIKGHQRTSAMGLHFRSLFKAAVAEIRNLWRQFDETLFVNCDKKFY